MLQALRRGVEACVALTNYRKDGSTFTNQLALWPVHDSHGVYRFCISSMSASEPGSKSVAPDLGAVSAALSQLPLRVLACVSWPSGQVHRAVLHSGRQTAKDAETAAMLDAAIRTHALFSSLSAEVTRTERCIHTA